MKAFGAAAEEHKLMRTRQSSSTEEEGLVTEASEYAVEADGMQQDA
jgi:hypothetical protein